MTNPYREKAERLASQIVPRYTAPYNPDGEEAAVLLERALREAAAEVWKAAEEGARQFAQGMIDGSNGRKQSEASAVRRLAAMFDDKAQRIREGGDE